MYYTKYRPQKFSEISKPNDTAAALMSQLSKGTPAHAYLFVGPRGTGKTTTARILAKALNCSALSDSGDPCLECASCLAVKQGNFVDLIEIDAASNRGIDDIRDLREKIKLSPSQGEAKVYIIDEVHMLTTEAFNALLKTLEEPPRHAYFILCTTELHKVPDTIKSRCQVFKFKRATKAQLLLKLNAICEAEGVDYLKKEDLEKIAEASFGGFRDAETILQQVVEGSLDPNSFVGLASQQTYVDFVSKLSSANTKDALNVLHSIVEEGLDLHVWTLGLLEYLRDILFLKADAYENIIDMSDTVLEQAKSQAGDISYSKLVQYMEVFLDSGNQVDDSLIPQLPLELAVVKICEDVDDSQGNSIQNDGTPPDNTNRKPIKSSDKNNADENNLDSSKPNTPKNVQENMSEIIVSPTKTSISIDEYGADFDVDDESEGATSETVEVVIDFNASTVDISVVQSNWPEIVKEIIGLNASIHTLLKSAAPLAIRGNVLDLEVLYKFHKERLESPKTRTILENLIEEKIGDKLNINCVVNADKRPKKKMEKGEVGELTDANISAPIFAGEMPDDITDLFDGGLPL